MHLKHMALVFAGLVISAGSPPTFDLICTSSEANKRQLVEERLRVDLKRRLYCTDTCVNLWRVTSVTPSRIVLREGLEGGRHPTHVSIDLLGGRVRIRAIIPGQNIDRSGTCSFAPFSGFPRGSPLVG